MTEDDPLDRVSAHTMQALIADVRVFIDAATRDYRPTPPDADTLAEFRATWETWPERHRAAIMARAFPRRCYWISGRDLSAGQYVPGLVTEFEPGYGLMSGNGRFASPWRWGTTMAQARAVCDQANRETFGLEPADAADIVLSSMIASTAGSRDD